MGEYGMYQGQEVKIGTCEDMLYLRADQARQIQPLSGNVDPVRDAGEIRFRFPFPDEDNVAPGSFNDPFRTVKVHGDFDVLAKIDHDKIQFKASVGILVMLPCPRSQEGRDSGLKFGYNGYSGPLRFGQQRLVDGRLVLIAQCGDCETAFRLPTLADAEPVIVACRSEADRRTRDDSPDAAKWWHTIADRITKGYEGFEF